MLYILPIFIALCFGTEVAALIGLKRRYGCILRASSPSDSFSLNSLRATQESIANLFSRLAEKRILLNIPGAGSPEIANCCHSGCDSCAYSRVFDEMRSGRPKWVPLYSYTKFIDDREHQSALSAVLDETFSKEEFKRAVLALPSQPCMGPAVSYSFVEDNSLFEAIDVLWRQVCKTLCEDQDSQISREEFYKALKILSNQVYGLTYMEFKAIFPM